MLSTLKCNVHFLDIQWQKGNEIDLVVKKKILI